MEFRGKHIVITGASTGIGRELAVALGRCGARIAAGGDAQGVKTDVADRDACGRLIDAAVARFGPPDALVNNAGISMVARFEEVTDLGIFEQLMRVNYLGAVYCTHFALPHLKKT